MSLDRVVIAKEFESHRQSLIELVQGFDQSHDPLIGTGDRNVIKRMEFKGISVAVKSFKRPNWINRWVYRYWRKSKSERSFMYAQKLRSMDIGTPTPVAFMETRNLLGIDRSYYLSLHLDAPYTFRDLIHDLELPKRAELIQAFTAFTFDLHEKGVLFQDHSPGNTLICWEGERPGFYLVDLNRMIFTNLNRAQRIQNFARLTPLKTMTDQMSEVYARLAQWPEDALKRDMWRVTENFQKRFHRKRRLKKKLFFWR